MTLRDKTERNLRALFGDPLPEEIEERFYTSRFDRFTRYLRRQRTWPAWILARIAILSLIIFWLAVMLT